MFAEIFFPKIPNNKGPGCDLMTAFWLKPLRSLHPRLTAIFEDIKNGVSSVPEWLAVFRSIFEPKILIQEMQKISAQYPVRIPCTT